MMNKKRLYAVALGTTTLLSGMPPALAQPQYMAPTGATQCSQCHLDNFGGGYKPGMIAASLSPLGKFAGLKAWLNPTTPPVAADTKPVVHPINPQWDITVGESPLSIPLQVSDAEDDSFVIKGSAPLGATVSTPVTDSQSHLPMATLNWKPTAAQAGKSYNISLTANETGTGRTLVSSAVTATVNVWPARVSATKNVSQLMIQRAQWNNNQLLLEGKVLFNSKVTAAQRTNLLATLQLDLTSKSGLVVSSPAALVADSTGNWKKTVQLSGSQVPCAAKVSYENLVALRSVKLAPAATCVK
jgi:hypothetical protein